jgi:hypothetical protein
MPSNTNTGNGNVFITDAPIVPQGGTTLALDAPINPGGSQINHPADSGSGGGGGGVQILSFPTFANLPPGNAFPANTRVNVQATGVDYQNYDGLNWTPLV